MDYTIKTHEVSEHDYSVTFDNGFEKVTIDCYHEQAKLQLAKRLIATAGELIGNSDKEAAEMLYLIDKLIARKLP